MSRILVLCEQGINRSVHIASLLRHTGNDVLSAGIMTNSRDTLAYLFDWAERIIITAEVQQRMLPADPKIELWDVGPDTYSRPYNPELYRLSKRLVKERL